MNSLSQRLSKAPEPLVALGRKQSLKPEFERSAISQFSPLYRAAVYLTRDRTEAEDLVQETYLRAFRFFDRFQAGTNCRAWLLSTMPHLFLNRYRQRKREPEVSLTEEGVRPFTHWL